MMLAVVEIVSQDTGIAIGLVVSLLLGAVSCTAWIGRRLNKIDERFGELSQRLNQIEQRELENVTLSQLEVIALRTKMANPDANVVDPRDPSKMISAGKA